MPCRPAAPSVPLLVALALAAGACSAPKPEGEPRGSGRMVPADELPETFRAAAASWKEHGAEWERYRDLAQDDPALARFLVENLVDVMVDAYTSSQLAAAGDLAGPFERAQRDLVALSWYSERVLVELVAVGDSVVAYLATDTLAAMDLASTAPLAAELLARPEEQARRRGAELLTRLSHARDAEPQVMLALERVLLEDADWSVRAQAALAVGARGQWARDSTTPRRMLSLALDDEDPAVVEAAAGALRALGDPAAVPALIDALERLGAHSQRARTVRAVQLALQELTGVPESRSVAGWRAWVRQVGR